jgi:hypothetical protein
MTSLASAEQLPALLRAPPWATGRRAPEPPALQFPPMQTAPHFTWSNEQREEARLAYEKALWRPIPMTPDEIERYLDDVGIRAETRAGLQAGQSLQPQQFVEPAPTGDLWFDNLLRMPDPLSLALWNGVPVSRWSDTTDGALLTLLARHSHTAAPGLLAYASQRPVQGLRVGLWLDSEALAAIALRSLRALKVARRSATDWLLAHPDTAAQVLLRQLFGKADGAREDARAALHALAAGGLQPALECAAQSLGHAAAQGLREQLDADPLLRLPSRLPKLPAFFQPAALHRPRLTDGGAALPDDAMRHLGLMLAISKPDQPYAGLDAVRAACTAASLAEFAWTLFEAWWAADAPSQAAWCFDALGPLGDDSTAHRLGARALRMAREGAKNRAQAAVDLLAGFGSDAALMHLNHLVERCKVPLVRNRASAKIDAVARARGLSRIELADRLVPTLGLDESRTLDFGARQFEIGFDEALMPFVRDAQQARLKDLPKPRQSDDAAKATAAALRWKQLKAEVRSLARVQIGRLEQAMVDQRRWPLDDFRAFFVVHPLMRELAARLLWSVFDVDGRFVDACRIAEDATFSGAQDSTCLPPPDAQFGIAHPLALPQALADAFRQQFADYELLQPFAQLTREVFAPSLEEAAQASLGRFNGRGVATGAVIGLLERGWVRGPTAGGGMIYSFERPLEASGARASLRFEPGMYVARLSMEPRQTLQTVSLADAAGQPVTFSNVDPIQCSELLRDLHRLAPHQP